MTPAPWVVGWRHIEQLQLARDCASLGARLRTLKLLTGLTTSALIGLCGARRNGGRFPNSVEWMHREANLIAQVEASMFASLFSTAIERGCPPGPALVGAFRAYVANCPGQPVLSFDRAFDLACHVKGLWLHTSPAMTLLRCDVCGARSLSALGDIRCGGAGCVFCKLIYRYPKDKRLQRHFAQRPCGPLPEGITALHRLLF